MSLGRKRQLEPTIEPEQHYVFGSIVSEASGDADPPTNDAPRERSPQRSTVQQSIVQYCQRRDTGGAGGEATGNALDERAAAQIIKDTI